jgi:polyferredoxin/tetratricopeptide (TPR) repeat protein
MEAVKSGVINAGAIFFAIALLATLVLGRWFCGWGCHLVMLQDLCGWMLRKAGIKPKPFRSRLLVYVPLALALYMFVWPAVYRWGVAPLSVKLHRTLEWIPALAEPSPWQGLRLEVTTSDFWHTFPGVLVAIPFLLICGFATVYFLGNKGFCTYGCPYGGFFAPLEQYAPARIRVTDDCEQCGHCTAVCTSNVRVHEEVRAYGMVVDPGCMKCLDCVSVCPNDALYFGFGRPASAKGAPRGAAPRRVSDLSRLEEVAFAVIFLGAFLAVRGVYQVVPMLMAAGVAGCVTWLAWKLWRMARDPSANLHRFRLKDHGRLRRGGVVFAVAACLALLLTAHSGAVRVLMALADRADRRVTLPRMAIFSEAPMMLDPAQAGHADRGLRLYALAGWVVDGGIGLLPDRSVLPRRAWLHACRHEFAEAERLLQAQVARFGPDETVCRDVAVLMRMSMDYDRARAYYDDLLRAHSTWVRMLDDQLVWLDGEGESEAAIIRCRTALERLASGGADVAAARLHVMRRLSLLLLNAGRLDEAIEMIERTIEIDDQNAAAFTFLADAYRRRGDDGLAIGALERAVALRPDAADLRDILASLLEAEGRLVEAEQQRAEASRLRGGG